MPTLTESEHTNRLIRLLMMLPAPDREDEHNIFWQEVAEENQVSFDYVAGKIGAHLELVLLKHPTRGHPHHRGLASYALYFFGQSSAGLVSYISSCLDPGAPNDSVGQVWVQRLRECAFAVFEESTSPNRVHQASVEWLRTHSPTAGRARGRTR